MASIVWKPHLSFHLVKWNPKFKTFLLHISNSHLIFISKFSRLFKVTNNKCLWSALIYPFHGFQSNLDMIFRGRWSSNIHKMSTDLIKILTMHSALKLEKKCNSKSTKTHFLQFQKWKKINFCTRKKFKSTKNAIFGLFSGAKNDFLPFL